MQILSDKTSFPYGIFLDGVQYELDASGLRGGHYSALGGEIIQDIPTNNGCLYIKGELIQPDQRYTLYNNGFVQTNKAPAPTLGVNYGRLSKNANIVLARLRKALPLQGYEAQMGAVEDALKELQGKGFLVGHTLTPRAFQLTSSKLFRPHQYETQRYE